MSRRSFFLSTLVIISVFGSTFVPPKLCALACELSNSSKYTQLFPNSSSNKKKRTFRDYLPFQEMLAALPGKSPSAMMGIIAAEITFQVLRAVGLVAAINGTRIAVNRFPDLYFAFSSFATRLAKTKPTNQNELFCEAVDAVTNAF